MSNEEEQIPAPEYSVGSAVYTPEGIRGVITAVHVSEDPDEEHEYDVDWEDVVSDTQPESLFQ